jgi:mono/diheme cytochrome c family protein
MLIRAAAVIVAAVTTAAGASAHGSELSPAANYMIHCMGCHLADGAGSPPDVPDVRGEMGRMLSVEGGREYLVQVPGAAQAPISDAELAAIVNYMLETFSAETLPDDYRPLTVDEVAEWREHWLPDVARVRQELLDALARRKTR